MDRVNWNQAVRPSTHDLIAAINSGADDIERIDGALDVLETVLDGKAGVSGTYPDFVAGETLSIRSGIRSNTFLTHALDSDVASGIAEVQRILGNTVVWNQLNANSGSTATSHGITLTKNNDGSWTANGTANGTALLTIFYLRRENGHKYLIRGCAAGGSADTYYLGFSGAVIDTGAGGIYASNSSTALYLYFIVKEGTTLTNLVIWPQCFDLTVMYGSGNEPTTPAAFAAQYGSDYKPYSAPALLSSNIAGIQGASACEFAEQTLRGIGTAQDVMTKAGIKRKIGIRDYASGDESDSSVRTDGTHTAYILATPTTEPFTEPIDLTYRVEAGGTEAWILPDNTQSAAVTGEIAYPLDPARALITHESFADFIDKLGAYIGATITETWDGSKYTYAFASGRSALLGSIESEPDALEVTEKDDIVKEIIEDERKEQ